MYYCRSVDDQKDVMGEAEPVDGEQVTELEEGSESDSENRSGVIISCGCVSGFQ